ncbi:unnamed protein product [Schistosoma haematobium]|nr:unnamed protein product [Schistosoma haematobium]
MMSGSRPHISITFRKSKKPQLNDSVRIMRNRGLLNTSRRLLQKSVNQSFTSATSLRANNASLAKKLAELQVELNNQKMATQQANIELLNCRMEVVRLQAYKEAKERIKACILNVHELLCSQIEMGMSMMNYVKDSISVLDKNDSLELLSNPTSSLLGETVVDPNAFDSVCRKEFTKPAQQITEQNVRQLSIVYPEVQSPSSSTSLITGPVKMAFSPNDHSIAKNISTNHINNNRFNVQPIPLIETLNTDVKSSQSICQEPVEPSCEEVLPEILTSPITCISENNIASKRCPPIVDTNVNNVDLDNDNDIDNTYKNISPVHFSVQSLPQSCVSVNNKPSVIDSKNIDQLVVPNLVNSCNSKNNECVVNPVDHHEIQSARPHLVRQARLNSKPIIDTSSFMESFIVKTTTKEKKKKSGKHRLIRVRDSDDEGENDINIKGDKLKNNIGVVGGDEDGSGRVIETCFRRPGELVFRVDSKNVNPSSTIGVSDKQTTRSKSKLPATTINQQSRSKSKPQTTTTTTTTAYINSINSKKTNKDVNSNEFKKLSKVVGTEIKTNIFDLSMNRTADLSVLPPTLNDLRIKHKEQRQQQVDSNTEAQKDTTAKMAMTTRKRSVLGELQQQEDDKLYSVVKNNNIVDEHRRLSVVLTPICDENQPPFDAPISNSKNNKRQFRRLYLFDQENEDNDDNGNDVDDGYRLKNMKADVGNTAGKQSKDNNPTSSIGKLGNNRNSNLPMTINPKVTTSRSRKRN